MKRIDVKSSNLKNVGFEDGKLEIEFVSGGIFQYTDVPEEVYQKLMDAKSIGSFFHSHIKHKFKYEKVLNTKNNLNTEKPIGHLYCRNPNCPSNSYTMKPQSLKFRGVVKDEKGNRYRSYKCPKCQQWSRKKIKNLEKKPIDD